MKSSNKWRRDTHKSLRTLDLQKRQTNRWKTLQQHPQPLNPNHNSPRKHFPTTRTLLPTRRWKRPVANEMPKRRRNASARRLSKKRRSVLDHHRCVPWNCRHWNRNSVPCPCELWKSHRMGIVCTEPLRRNVDRIIAKFVSVFVLKGFCVSLENTVSRTL